MLKKLLLSTLVATAFISSCKTDPVETTPTQTIQVGGLFSLSGNWSSLGLTSKVAMNIAVSDVNNYLSSISSPYRFSANIFDTKLDTALALSAITNGFNNQQIRYFIGPQSSAELGTIKNFADSNNILVISQGSTASSLAIANDAIFRFCPGDAVEGSAIARTIYKEGKRHLMTLSRDDAGNKGLQTATGAVFTTQGGTVEALTPYPINTTDFSSVLANLKQQLKSKLSSADSSQIGIYIASFDECALLFKQASSDPIFSKVNWYGGDGVFLSSALTSDIQAAAFASKVKFFAPTYGLPSIAKPDLASIQAEIKAATGLDADAYALAVYDAVWVLAKTITTKQSSDFSTFKTDFTNTANNYDGLTGMLSLNANGDRSTGTFDYYGIVFENNQFIWKFSGKSE